VTHPVGTASLVTEIADATARCTPRIWGFGVGGMLSALLRADDALSRPDLTDRVAVLVTPSLAAAPDPTDHLIAVEPLLALAARRPHLDVRDICGRWLRAVLGARPAHPGGPCVHRPDLCPWQSTVWVDCMHTDGPGLAMLGHREEAVEYATASAAALQMPNGLFQHGYDVDQARGNGVAWGRGQAWALQGLAGTLAHAYDDGLARRLARLADALAEHERNGQWRTVVDDPASPVEPSVAAYVAHDMSAAISAGLLDPGYGAMTGRAWQATLRRLSSGTLAVSEATPVGAPAGYHRRALGVFPWGQAPVLHAALDRLEEDA
jgi:rhamnogalacturonyl hydrolase YesR